MDSGHDSSVETVRNAVSMIVLAIGTGAAAVGILYTRWRKWTKFRGVLIVIAGTLAAVSLIFWIKVGGPEFGSAYAVINIAIVADALHDGDSTAVEESVFGTAPQLQNLAIVSSGAIMGMLAAKRSPRFSSKKIATQS